MSPLEPSRRTAALIPPAPGLSLAWLQARPQAQAHSCQTLLPQRLTPAQLGSLQSAWLVLKAALKTSPSTEHRPEPPASPEPVPLEARLFRPAWDAGPPTAAAILP